MKQKFYTRMAMVVTAMLMFAFTATAQTTIQVQIAGGGDDAEEYMSDVGGQIVGDLDIGSSDVELGWDDEPQIVGLLFRGVAIPPGSVVSNAFVQFTVDEVKGDGRSDGAMTLDITGTLEASAADITADPMSLSARTPTVAKVVWTPGPSIAEFDAGVNEQTPDLSAVINEVIGQAGWAIGGNILINCAAGADITVEICRCMESSDGEFDKAAVLNVTFAEGTSINTASEFTYTVYPNPTEGKIFIDNPSNNEFSYELYNINGQLVASRYNLSGSSTELDVSGFAKGMYFVDVTNSDRTETHKLIVR